METNTALPPVSETPAKPKRSVKKILLWVLGIPAAILLLLVSIGAWWLWGWKLSSAPDFHESRTAEERVALTKFDQYLRGEFCETLHKEVMGSDRENQTDELAVARLLTDVNAATESRTPLQTIAQRAVRCKAAEGESLAEAAACMKLLLDAGADPNLLPSGDADSSSGKETPLCIIEKELYKRGELQAANACCEPQESPAAILRRMADMLRAAGATPTPQEKLHEAKRRRTLRTLGLLDDEEEEPATEEESGLDE